MNENGYIRSDTRGARIAEKRMSRNLTLRELAGMLGISVSTLSRYEAGLVDRIPRPTMEKLAALLGTTAAYLQYGNEQSAEAEGNEAGQSLIRNRTTDYLHIYRGSEISRLFRSGDLQDREFVLIVDEDTALPPRILPGDQVTIALDDALCADAVCLLLRTDGRLCLRDVKAVDAQGIRDAFLLKTRQGGDVEVFFPADSYRVRYRPIGICVKLETQIV